MSDVGDVKDVKFRKDIVTMVDITARNSITSKNKGQAEMHPSLTYYFKMHSLPAHKSNSNQSVSQLV